MRWSHWPGCSIAATALCFVLLLLDVVSELLTWMVPPLACAPWMVCRRRSGANLRTVRFGKIDIFVGRIKEKRVLLMTIHEIISEVSLFNNVYSFRIINHSTTTTTEAPFQQARSLHTNISMEHRLRRKHLKLNSDTEASNEIKETFFLTKNEKIKTSKKVFFK